MSTLPPSRPFGNPSTSIRPSECLPWSAGSPVATRSAGVENNDDVNLNVRLQTPLFSHGSLLDVHINDHTSR
eukprot:4606313-Prymnesium_polylepis.1